MRGLSIDGLKADLQQRLLETVNNTTATTHTTNTAREGTVNTKDNTKNANNAALPTEAPTHVKKTTNTEETDKNSDNAKMHTEMLGLRSICNIATALTTNTLNDKEDVGISEDSDDNSSSVIDDGLLVDGCNDGRRRCTPSIARPTTPLPPPPPRNSTWSTTTRRLCWVGVDIIKIVLVLLPHNNVLLVILPIVLVVLLPLDDGRCPQLRQPRRWPTSRWPRRWPTSMHTPDRPLLQK